MGTHVISIEWVGWPFGRKFVQSNDGILNVAKLPICPYILPQRRLRRKINVVFSGDVPTTKYER